MYTDQLLFLSFRLRPLFGSYIPVDGKEKLQIQTCLGTGLQEEDRLHIMNCIKCKKLRGTPSSQKMADLPRERMDEAEPFTCTGVDCFGPSLIKERRSEVKRWGILFTYLSSRTIHL